MNSDAFPHLSQTCWCGACDADAVEALPAGDILRLVRRMNLCPTCGNKRCPRSWFHDYRCTGSNEPGQTPRLAIDPIKLCCGAKMSAHRGPQCPDDKVMCCICFERFQVPDLSVDEGQSVDVCKSCAAMEAKR